MTGTRGWFLQGCVILEVFGSFVRCWWETWPAVHLGRLVLLVAQVVWFLDRFNELIIDVIICISMVAETWKQQLMRGNTAMSLREISAWLLDSVLLEFLLHIKTNPTSAMLLSNRSFHMIFMTFPVVTFLSLIVCLLWLWKTCLMAQVSRYTIAGCVFKLLYLSGRFLWVCNHDVRWKSNDFAVFDKSTCIIHT